MSRPLVATYRLQFREGTTFDTGRDLAPYLSEIGVSHLYASPIFSASPGSTHGYDVTDYNEFEEELGGAAGFVAMSDALSSKDLGLILDFVPNHMGVSPKNHWWEDVLRWGRDSRRAEVFDISWDAEKILVPVLGRPYGEALEAGDLSVRFDEERGQLRFDASGYGLPIDPRTYGHVFNLMEDDPNRERLVRRFAVSSPAESEELWAGFSEKLAEPGFRKALEAAIERINADKAALHELHETQAWRLAWWRTARERLTYRRFFEIADLIGVRQESRRVFTQSHETILRLARERRLDGIRIDHVDGVADPKGYLQQLKAAFQSVRRSPVVHVEKILTGDERLRRDWEIEGTTGYEFITALAGLYVDASKEEAMTEAYHGFIGKPEDLRAMILGQKRAIFKHNLAGELAYLTGEAMAVAERGLSTRDLGHDTLRRSIVEVAAALPVYRTYVSPEGVPRRDVALIDDAVDLACTYREVEADEPIHFIGRLVKLDFETGPEIAGALNFTRRLQQTTGAVMAKAVEDTVFYRYNRLIALNEVGGEPDHYGADVSAFHEAMEIRLEDQPEGLLASTTHDTKRSEDARARLYTLSEAPERWNALVSGFAEALSEWRKPIEDGLVSPDAPTEWGFYQSLLGVLPADFDPQDQAARASIAERLQAYMEKAVREAKRWTSWTSPAEPYETALRDFVAAALDSGRSGPFLADFWRDAQPFVAAGALNSLSQTLIKLTAPGVPDIYQGTEFYDFSLVDPDNRREVDFAMRGDLAKGAADWPTLLADWRSGRVKAKLTLAGLKLRKEAPALFTKGDYVALEAEGPLAAHVVAFARTDTEGRAAITIVPRLSLQLLDGAETPALDAARWAGTTLRLPDALAGLSWRDALSDAPLPAGATTEGTVDLSVMLATLPVGLLKAGLR